MTSKLLQGFRLGPFKVEPLRGAVTGPQGVAHHLEPKVMDVFVCLAEHDNEVVTREDLQQTVWSGRAVTDEPLTRAIGELRRALANGEADQQYIETVPKRGYRLIGEIYLPDGSRLKNAQLHPQSRLRKLAFVSLAALALALAYAAFDILVIDRTPEYVLPEDMSIVVLPFVNISNDPDSEYLSEGLSEELRNLLAKTPGLKVIGRTSSLAFEGTNEDVAVIGETLGAKTVLNGSVQRSRDIIRIKAQLIDVADRSIIWSESYDRPITGTFELQDNFAAAIIDDLQTHVAVDPIRGRPTENFEAYALFLRGTAALHDNQMQNAAQAFQQAIELDPEFAEAYEMLAYCYFNDMGISSAESQQHMVDAAAKALDIDPELAWAQALYESGNSETSPFPGQIAALERAVREDPGNVWILEHMTWTLMLTGYHQEAANFAKRFVKLDPRSPTANLTLVEAQWAAGYSSEVRAPLKVFAQLSGDAQLWYIGELYLRVGMDDIAVPYFERWLEQRGYPDSSWLRELVSGARDPVSGQAFLDRRIPEIVASLPNGQADNLLWKFAFWYNHFGFTDRFYDHIFNFELTMSPWTDALYYVQDGTINRRMGFTAHPRYIEVAESLGIIDVWEQRGPPDFCEKVEGQWVCE